MKRSDSIESCSKNYIRAWCQEQRRDAWSKIHNCLAENGVTLQMIADKLNLTKSAISACILGKNSPAATIIVLRESGVPEDILFDPLEWDKRFSLEEKRILRAKYYQQKEARDQAAFEHQRALNAARKQGLVTRS